MNKKFKLLLLVNFALATIGIILLYVVTQIWHPKSISWSSQSLLLMSYVVNAVLSSAFAKKMAL